MYNLLLNLGGSFALRPCSEYEACLESPQLLKPTYLNLPEHIRIASEIDLQLIETLREDGRAGGRAFAERTKLSEATVSRRIAQLEESGLVRVRGYVDLHNAGCNAAVMIRFSAMQSPVIFAQALAKRSCCYRVATIAGRSEIITLVVATTPLLLLAELEEIMAEHKNVVIDQVSPILDIIPPREARRIANSTNEPVIERRATVRRSHFQANLIRTLQSDFRMTLTRISEAVGLSGPSTSESVQQVIDMGLVRHIVVVDQNFLGTPLCAQLRISAKRDFKKLRKRLLTRWIQAGFFSARRLSRFWSKSSLRVKNNWLIGNTTSRRSPRSHRLQLAFFLLSTSIISIGFPADQHL